MKGFLGYMICFALCLAGELHSAEVAVRSVDERAEENLQRVEQTYLAKVTRIYSLNGTVQVEFLTSKRVTDWDDHRALKNASKTFAIEWSDIARPMPWIVGSSVYVGVSQGTVLAVDCGNPEVMMFRMRRDQEIELLVKIDGQHFLLHPHRLGTLECMGMNPIWIKDIGLVITGWMAGDGNIDAERPELSRAGIVPANIRGTVSLGRSGWRDLRAWCDTHQNKVRSSIPQKQKIGCAG